MATTSVKKLSVEELKNVLAQETARYQKLKFAHAITPLQNPMDIRRLRRYIASVKTELRARELAA